MELAMKCNTQVLLVGGPISYITLFVLLFVVAVVCMQAYPSSLLVLLDKYIALLLYSSAACCCISSCAPSYNSYSSSHQKYLLPACYLLYIAYIMHGWKIDFCRPACLHAPCCCCLLACCLPVPCSSGCIDRESGEVYCCCFFCGGGGAVSSTFRTFSRFLLTGSGLCLPYTFVPL